MTVSVVELVRRREHRGFPDRAFVALAVAHDDEHAVTPTLNASRQGHAEAQRQAVAERAGGRLDAGDAMRAGLFGECAAGLGVGVEQLFGKNPR